MGDWLFGCDVCQNVCPWNVRFARETDEPAYRARPADAWPTLREIAAMTPGEFDAAFGRTALTRAGPSGLARNAAALLEGGEGTDEATCPAA